MEHAHANTVRHFEAACIMYGIEGNAKANTKHAVERERRVWLLSDMAGVT